VQADITNLRDLWATRSVVIEQMGGLPPNLVICNSGLTESGYTFGRAPRARSNETSAMRRARVRQHFLDNLDESRLVSDTKIDGFLATTHLWAGEALHHDEHVQFVYVSSRQATDPGIAVPGYAISNWAVLQLPRVLKVNLGRDAGAVTCSSVLFPFIRTSMTDVYTDNEKVFGRWQPRMLATHECAEAFMQLLARPQAELDDGMFELRCELTDPDNLSLTWCQLTLDAVFSGLDWSSQSPIDCPL